MTTKRLLPESNYPRIYIFDEVYRCDRWDKPELYDQSSLTFTHQPTTATTQETDNVLDEQSPKRNFNGSKNNPIFPQESPTSRNSIKEYVHKQDGEIHTVTLNNTAEKTTMDALPTT